MISLLDDMRASVRRWRLAKWEVTGIERYSGHPIRMTYFGHNFGFYTLVEKVFAPGYSTTRKGHAWLGAPGFPLTPSERSSDIVAIEIDYDRWKVRDTGAGFYLPIWTRTEIILVDARRLMKKSSSLKDDLRKIRKNKVVCEVSNSPEDLCNFYYHIYKPYILARHGSLSVPDPWDKCAQMAQNGELIVARDDTGGIIGGHLLEKDNEKMHARLIGLISDDKEILKKGAMAAMYLASFDRAEFYGFDRIFFGATGPFLNDGLLGFKKKWGLRLLNECINGIWLQFNNATTGVESFLVHNPFIYRNAGKVHGVVFSSFSDLMNDENPQMLTSQYYLPGMETFNVCDVGAFNNKKTRDMESMTFIPDTRRRLYTSLV